MTLLETIHLIIESYGGLEKYTKLVEDEMNPNIGHRLRNEEREKVRELIGKVPVSKIGWITGIRQPEVEKYRKEIKDELQKEFSQLPEE